MAVVGNVCTAIGDVLLIVPGTPILGITALVDYSDTIVGETGTRYFNKFFRYTTNGIHYSDWVVLTDLNLQAVSVSLSDVFLIEYRYVRAGTDNTGNLEFVNITLNATYGQLECGFYYDRSIFKIYFECYDDEIAIWCTNVLNKIYEEGFLAAYIKRGEGALADTDFIEFWRAISCYFAYFVTFARKLETFYSNKNLLVDFLKQRNLFLCEGSSDLVDLVYLMWHYYQEIRYRGTRMVTYRKGKILPWGDTKEVNGELLRLFCVGLTDEFIFQIVLSQYLGWNLQNSSPMWRGMTNQIAVNKAWEDTQDVIDLANYPLVEDTYITNGLEIFSEIKPMAIKEVPDGVSSGVNIPSPFVGGEKLKAILVNPNLSYEITFWVKQIQQDNNFTFGVVGLDGGDNIINFQSVTVPPGDPSTENNFFTQQNLIDINKWYFVRGIIFAATAPQKTDPNDYTLNIGFGNHLRFKGTNIVKIFPVILNDMKINSAGNEIKLWDIKVRPLCTPFSTCFIQVKNFIFTWVKDNNYSLTAEEKADIIRKYLFPYNSNFTNIYI